MPILCALTTFLQQKQSAQGAAGQNLMMSAFMPLFIGFMAVTFPAGLGLYWVAGNIVQLLHQRWIHRQAGFAGETVH